MGKLQNSQPGFSVIEGLLILVIIGILGFTGWYAWKARNNTAMSLKPDNSTTQVTNKKSSVKQTAATPLPEGWVWYEGDGFKFGYPGSYGQFFARSTTQVTGGTQTMLTSGQPASVPFPGISTSGMFVLDKYDAVNAPIQGRKYGPTVKLENGKWMVTQDNPGDPKPYKVGDTYGEVKLSKEGGTTVYTFTSGDEGGVIYTLAFTAKGHLYTLQLPEFDTGTYASQTPNDQKPYDQLSSQLAEHIIVE